MGDRFFWWGEKGELIEYLDFSSFAPPTSAGGFAVVESWGHD